MKMDCCQKATVHFWNILFFNREFQERILIFLINLYGVCKSFCFQSDGSLANPLISSVRIIAGVSVGIIQIITAADKRNSRLAEISALAC